MECNDLYLKIADELLEKIKKYRKRDLFQRRIDKNLVFPLIKKYSNYYGHSRNYVYTKETDATTGEIVDVNLIMFDRIDHDYAFNSETGTIEYEYIVFADSDTSDFIELHNYVSGFCLPQETVDMAKSMSYQNGDICYKAIYIKSKLWNDPKHIFETIVVFED